MVNRYRLEILVTLMLLFATTLHDKLADAGEPTEIIALPSLTVKPTEDFVVDGTGSSPHWSKTEWVELNRRPKGELDYDAKVKVLYSERGMYFLMEGSDRQVTATLDKDFEDLWNEDVFEVFLWPDESTTTYFEYEISPLGKELPLLIPNHRGKFLGWIPWHYEGDRKVQKAVSVLKGQAKSGAKIEGWQAEFFVPYALLSPLQNVPPKPGVIWRANFYRVDHDDKKTTAWDWARVGPSFHEYAKFGTLLFE
jgi:Carbohydrate family 9 binding domain-like